MFSSITMHVVVDSLILAVALSIDAMVVSFSQGLIFLKNKRKNSFMLAFSVGLFQFLMPVIGWYLAKFIYNYVSAFAGWIAAVIFFLLGAKFIKDALTKKDEETPDGAQCTIASDYKISLKFLFLVSLATSIDALAAGMSFNFLKMPILIPAIIIGVVTFINSLIGFWCGYCFKQFNSTKMEVFAGAILIVLAVKVLIESYYS